MSASPEELEKRIAWLAGQLAVAGMALNALVRQRGMDAEVNREIDEAYEQMMSRTLPSQFPEAFLEGMQLFHRQALGRRDPQSGT